MATTRKIGEILSQIVPLSTHDVEEILSEQRISHHRFGDCALSLGKCEPQDVWLAFSGQLQDGTRHVDDLVAFGIDSQALCHIPAELARSLCVIPVRYMDGGLVVAASEACMQHAMGVLKDAIHLPLHFITADEEQICDAIERLYPEVRVPA